TTLEVTDSTFEDNAWAGIVVAGGHRVSIERTTFVANGEVGVLFLDSASGSVTASTFTGNTVGLAATGESEPVWLTSTVSGGEIGIQIEENSTAVIEDVEVRGASSAAVIVRGAATGAISGLTCTDVEYGLVIEDTAAPTLADNACELARAG
ncbi:MAG: right-handed parallel beta-helix repeat-containing protein, partial [Actinomycetes bacterium]|nr:right-handed parallel beta-helix repeat-containing protein [Actinomycetes bacterium]MDX5380959.1 right-handed parallel beta-helix repeat-containing protein [Actinomycetes bacterium]MDX5400077.1 right-handed parallel beta-helix repeat-containing protein [Actinomycetes bacterium]MDX5450720.1 right-handed parallel beta-helix repeat-containing protein [Actinomycetes bacterium]